MKPLTRAAAALLAALLGQVAQVALAQCVQLPGDTELTIDRLGRVLFRELATDRSRDLVVFGGGVCLELGGLQVWLEAESMVVHAPGPDARVEAEGAIVHAGDWQLVARSLVLGAQHGLLRQVTLEGAGVVGRADEVVLDVREGAMRAVGLELVTPTVRVSAEQGTFDAEDVVRVHGAVASTCACPPRSAPIRLEADAVELELRSGVLRIGTGVLVVDGATIPLPPGLTVSEQDLASLDVPFTLAVVHEGRRGWVLGLVEREDQGAAVSGDLAFGPAADPRWRVRLAAAEDGASVVAAARDGGLSVAMTRRVPLGEGLDLVLGQRLEAGAIRNRVHDGSATLTYRRPLQPAVDAIASAQLEASATAALTAQHEGGRDVVHPRGRLTLALTAATPVGALGSLSVRVDGGVTGYAGTVVRQAWIGVAPRWRASFGPLGLDATHTVRAVTGSSPFDDRVDRVAHVALSELRLSAAVPLGGVALHSAVDVRYDWRPDPLRPGSAVGLQRLRADLRLAGGASAEPEGSGLGWELALAIEAAGVLDAREERDAFVRASIEVTGIAGTSEAMLASEVGLGTEHPGVRSLVLAGATPLRFADGDVELVPYLAVDVWPVLAGRGWPSVSGHGLALRWGTCCGVVDVGYRAHPDGSLTTRLAFEVVPRVPSLEQLDD